MQNRIVIRVGLTKRIPVNAGIKRDGSVRETCVCVTLAGPNRKGVPMRIIIIVQLVAFSSMTGLFIREHHKYESVLKTYDLCLDVEAAKIFDNHPELVRQK